MAALFLAAFIVGAGVKSVQKGLQAHRDAKSGIEPEVKYDAYGNVRTPHPVYGLVMKHEKKRAAKKDKKNGIVARFEETPTQGSLSPTSPDRKNNQVQAVQQAPTPTPPSQRPAQQTLTVQTRAPQRVQRSYYALTYRQEPEDDAPPAYDSPDSPAYTPHNPHGGFGPSPTYTQSQRRLGK